MHRISFDGTWRWRLPFFLMPPATVDPRIDLRIARRYRHHVHDVVPALRRREVEDHLGAAESHVVAVTLDETRNGESALEIHDLGAVADEPADLGVGADGEDGGAAHGDRFRFGAGRIDGDDGAVPKHECGGFAGRRAWRAAGGEGRDEDDCAMTHG